MKKQLFKREDYERLQMMKEYISQLDSCHKLKIVDDKMYQVELQRLSNELEQLERIYIKKKKGEKDEQQTVRQQV